MNFVDYPDDELMAVHLPRGDYSLRIPWNAGGGGLRATPI